MSYLSEKNPSSASSYSYKYKSGTGKGFLLVAAMIYEMLGLCCPQCSFWLKLLMFRVDWRSVHHVAVISPLNKDWILSVAWGGWDLNLGPWNHHVHVDTTQPLPRHQRHQFASKSLFYRVSKGVKHTELIWDYHCHYHAKSFPQNETQHNIPWADVKLQFSSKWSVAKNNALQKTLLLWRILQKACGHSP